MLWLILQIVPSYMLKILNTQQIKDLDAFTIQNNSVTSIDLMERACKAFVNWFVLRFDSSKNVGVVCGTGNNGGDGLGIARILSEWGFTVKVWVVRSTNTETEDFKTNLGRMHGKVDVQEFPAKPAAEMFSDCKILIDAIIGSGLSRPAEGIHITAIRALNQAEADRVAVDIPSGLFADKHSSGDIVNANYTVSFQLPKLAFLLPENHAYVGEWHMVDIGLDKSFAKGCKTPYSYLTRKSARKLLDKSRPRFSHKGDYGHALLIAGSLGKMGAAVLAARGALRSGLGLLTVHAPSSGNSILQTSIPEAMVSIDPNDQIFSKAPVLHNFQVVGIGPGIGQADGSVAALKEVLASGKPMVIDADALNMLGANRELLHLVPPGSILTPHPKELERLVGSWNDDFERLDKQINLAKELKGIVVLKGAHTAIASEDGQVTFNCTGNPGMATAGSGDVLTGVLTGLLAQGYSSRDTAILGVYLHGLAGDMAEQDKGVFSLIASDIVDLLPAAFKSFS